MGNIVNIKRLLIALTVFTVLSKASFAEFTLKAPDIAHNGELVPVFTGNITPPLSTGDKFIIQLPDGSVALTTTLSAGMTLSSVSTRVRIFDLGDNTISATIYRSNGTSEYSEKTVEVRDYPALPLPDTNTRTIDVSDSFDYSDGKGVIRMLFSNDMATIDYVNTITITS